MSREIEYRAWHKEDKKMLHVCGIDWMVNLEKDCVEVGSVNCAERRSDGWVNGGSHDIEDVILMQYTGIKDKNGVKIYEGDVVRTTNAKGVVVFSQGSFIVEWGDYAIIAGEIRRCVYIPAWLENIYVIGNIHEGKK